MTPRQKSDLQKLKKATIDGMVRYMNYGGAESQSDPDYDPNFDAGYTQNHVDQCAKILDDYLTAVADMQGPSEDQKILNVAKKAVLSLNKLNQACSGSLIETSQREEICELIIVAAKRANLSFEGDFTEEWREW